MQPYYDEDGITIYHGDCREVLPLLPTVDAVVTDPPYAEVARDYGRLSEAEWHELMQVVVGETRRLVGVRGSGVFILQPNSKSVGSMRPWLWEFMAWTCKEWNMVQDVWWWNFAAPPTVHTHRDHGLMRPSLKACVWLGDANCFRNQDAVLMPIAAATLSDKRLDRHELSRQPSGYTTRHARALQTCRDRGGATPFNLLVCANSDSSGSSAALGHGAGTPFDLADWWVCYLTPDGGTICDPFCGAGTMLLAAQLQGIKAIGIEQHERYCEIAANRLRQKVLF